MTLHTYLDVEQGSQEWHDLRRGIVTASTVGRLITPSTLKPASNDESRALTALLAAERITDYTEPTWQSNDMFRGVIEEPRARDHYSRHHAPVEECGFLVRQERYWRLGYSPDGLVGDNGLLEIKSPRAKEHLRTVLAGEVPARYMAQLQAGLLVSGRDWIDYMSWHGGMPAYVTRVHPDPAWQDAIVLAVEKFEESVGVMVDVYRNATEHLPPTERLDYDAEMVILDGHK